MAMYRRVVLSGIVCAALASSALAQMKIEEQLVHDLRTKDRVRVLIVARPAIGVSNPLTASLQAVAGSLGTASKVRQIGDLPVATADITAEHLDTLKENPNVAFVVRDVPVPPTLVETGPLVGATLAHDKGVTGVGMTVAILDTGVQVDHPALAGSIIKEACFSTQKSPDAAVESLCPGGHETSLVAGAASGCPASVAGCKHGTHVAGIVAGHQMSANGKKFDGISPEAKLIAVQVFTLFKDEALCRGEYSCVLSYTSDQLRALEWVYKQRDKYKIASINMSLGGGYYDAYCDGSSALTEIIERLRSKGIATVIAAGNEGFYDGVGQPACISAAVSVSALNKKNELDISYSNVSELVDIAAPGTGIVSSVLAGGYETLSGTSMAAPHVAAAFALLRQKYPSETVKQLENRLISDTGAAVDPRTDTKLPILEVSHALEATAGSGESTNQSSDSNKSGTKTNSVIIRSEASSADILSAIQQNCPEANCQVKKIGKNTYKLDLDPAFQDGLTGGENSSFKYLKDILKDFDPSAKVFNNDLSEPLR